MSFTELKEQVATLSVEERFKLSAWLVELEQEKETEFRGEVSNRMSKMDAGKKMSMEEFEGRHQKLNGQGQ